MTTDNDDRMPLDVAEALITIFAAIFEATITKEPVKVRVLSDDMEELVNEVTEEVSDVIPEAELVTVQRETLH